jgi:integrase
LLWKVGLRPGEAFALTVGQFNPTTAELTIDRAVNDGVIGPTKTGKIRKPILPASIASELETYIRDRSAFTNPDALVFTTDAGKMIDSDNFRRRTFGDAAKAAGRRALCPERRMAANGTGSTGVRTWWDRF